MAARRMGKAATGDLSQVYGTPTRSQTVRAALGYAERGWPVFALRPGSKLPHEGSRGYLDATLDRTRITAMFNAHPRSNVGVATGSGFMVLDVDPEKWGAGSLDALEQEHGQLPETYTVETPRRGLHFYFALPPAVEVRCSAGRLGPGLDVRGEGGYVVAPPSATKRPYRVLEDRPLAPAPRWLLKALGEPQRADAPRPGNGGVAAHDRAVPGRGCDPIPEGVRNVTLTRIAGKLHDGTRDLGVLTAELLEINAERCEPPLPDGEVGKIAQSIHGREPCRSGRPKEVDELVEALSEFWHGQRWEGIAKKSEARFARALIREGRKVGRAIPRGLRVEKSFRQMAEILGTHRNTITNIVRRGKAAGWLRQDNAGRRGVTSGAFVLVDPRQSCDTFNHSRRMEASVTSPSRRRSCAELSTPHYRHRGPVGYSREHTLCVFEAHGPLSRESAAEMLGWSRPRDLERLHLERLVGLGLLEKRSELYAVPGDVRERADVVRGEKYSTLQPRVRRVRSVEGRWVHVVGESGMDASELERARLDRERHERERVAYANRHKVKAEPVRSEAMTPDGEVRELERVSVAPAGLVEALSDYLSRNPHRKAEPPGWLAVATWAEMDLPEKPTPEEVEVALMEIRRAGVAA